MYISVMLLLITPVVYRCIATPLSDTLKQLLYSKNHVFDDVTITDNVISIISNIRTPKGCGILCAEGHQCRSFSHNALDSTCRLYTEIFNNSVSSLTTPGSRHYFHPLGPCPSEDGFVLLRHLYMCFKVFNTTQNRGESRELCDQSGSRLIVLDTEEKNTAVSDYIKENIGTHVKYYIGLTDDVNEGDFVWENGHQVSGEHWEGEEPNGGQDENCVELNVDVGLWNDVPCHKLRGCICEQDI